MSEKPILLITGGTGKQGGAAIRALQAQRGDWNLRALVRNPESKPAQALRARGVNVVKGDLDDENTVRRALIGAYGVFSVQAVQEDADVEVRQGKLLASLASEAGVRHFVYSSVGGAGTNSGVPHFESKWAVENHIRERKLAATILRPVALMENMDSLIGRTMMLSMWKTFLPETKALQMVAVEDVGWFVAQAFAKSVEYIGKEIEIAGDSLTRTEAMRVLRENGRGPAIAFNMPGFMLKKTPEDIVLMFKWMAKTGFSADIRELRTIYPSLKTLAAWSRRHGKVEPTSALRAT